MQCFTSMNNFCFFCFSFFLFVYCSLDGQLLFFQLEFVSMNKFRFPCTKQVIDLVSAVKELHGLNSQELGKLLRDSENFTIHYVTEKESLLKVSHHHIAIAVMLRLCILLMDVTFLKLSCVSD